MLETPKTPLSESARHARVNALPLQEMALKHFLQDFTRERTFDNLSAGLGEDKAKAVVTGIGQAALSAAPELNGGGLGSVVVQTLARLTQQDLAGIARNESSAVGRAQAIVQEEIKAQKAQNPAVNQYAANSPDGRGLSADMRGGGILPGGGASRASSGRFGELKETTEAANFAKEIGAKPGDASLFVGSSAGMRDAIRSFLKDGKAITDDDVRNLGDVKSVMGLVRAGKIKPDDPKIPPSVQKIMKDMQDKGIDPTTADPKVIDDYFKKNPNALDAAKKANAEAIKAKANHTDDQLNESLAKHSTSIMQKPASPAVLTKPAPAGENSEQAHTPAATQPRQPKPMMGDV